MDGTDRNDDLGDTLKNLQQKYAEVWEKVKNPKRAAPQKLFNHNNAVEFKLRPSIIDRALQKRNNELPTSTPMIVNRKLTFTPEDSIGVSPIRKDALHKSREEASIVECINNNNSKNDDNDKTVQNNTIITLSSLSETLHGMSKESVKKERVSTQSLKKSTSSAPAKSKPSKLESIIAKLTQPPVDKTVQTSRKSLDKFRKMARSIYTQTPRETQTQTGDSLNRRASVSTSSGMSSEMSDIVRRIDDDIFPYKNIIIPPSYSDEQRRRKETVRSAALPWRPPSGLQSLPSVSSLSEKLPEDEEISLDDTFRPKKPPTKKVFTNRKKLLVGRSSRSRSRRLSASSKENEKPTAIVNNGVLRVLKESRMLTRSVTKNIKVDAATGTSFATENKQQVNVEDGKLPNLRKRTLKKKGQVEEATGVSDLEENEQRQNLEDETLPSKPHKKTSKKQEHVEESIMEEDKGGLLRPGKRASKKKEEATGDSLDENEQPQNLEDERLSSKPGKRTSKKQEHVEESAMEEDIEHENLEDQRSRSGKRASKKKEQVEETIGVPVLEENKQYENLEDQRSSKSSKKASKRQGQVEETTAVSLLEENERHQNLEDDVLSLRSGKKTSKKQEHVKEATGVSEENKQRRNLEDERSSSKSDKRTLKNQERVDESVLEDQKLSRSGKRATNKHVEESIEIPVLEENKQYENLEDQRSSKSSKKASNKQEHVEEENKQRRNLEDERSSSKSDKRTLRNRERVDEPVLEDQKLSSKSSKKASNKQERVEEATGVPKENQQRRNLEDERSSSKSDKRTLENQERVDEPVLTDQKLSSKPGKKASKKHVEESIEVPVLEENEQYENLEDLRLSKSSIRPSNTNNHVEETFSMNENIHLEGGRAVVQVEVEESSSKTNKKMQKAVRLTRGKEAVPTTKTDRKTRVEDAINILSTKVVDMEESVDKIDRQPNEMSRVEGVGEDGGGINAIVSFEEGIVARTEEVETTERENEILPRRTRRKTEDKGSENLVDEVFQEPTVTNNENPASTKKVEIPSTTSSKIPPTKLKKKTLNEDIDENSIEVDFQKDSTTKKRDIAEIPSGIKKTDQKEKNPVVILSDILISEANRNAVTEDAEILRDGVYDTTEKEVTAGNQKSPQKPINRRLEWTDEEPSTSQVPPKRNRLVPSARESSVKTKRKARKEKVETVTSVFSTDSSGDLNLRRSTRERRAPLPRSVVFYDLSVKKASTLFSTFTTSEKFRSSLAHSSKSRMPSISAIPTFSSIAEEIAEDNPEDEPQPGTSQQKNSVISGRVSKKQRRGKQTMKAVEALSDELRRSVSLEDLVTNQNLLNFCIGDKVKKIEWFCKEPKYQPFEEIPGVSMAVTLAVSDHGYSTGFLKIEPGRMKPKLATNKHSMTFVVVEGQGEVGVEDKHQRFKVPATFTVPKGSEYYIENTSNTKPLLLSFTRIVPPNDK